MPRLPGQQKALNYRKRRFAQELVKNGGDEHAAIEKSHPHLTPASKNNYVSQFRRDHDVQLYINHIAEAIPDSLLIEKHTALLEKTDEDGSVHVAAVKAGLDMAYKLKGSYAPEKQVSFNADLSDFSEASSEQLLALIAEADYVEEEEETDTEVPSSSAPELARKESLEAEPLQPTARELPRDAGQAPRA